LTTGMYICRQAQAQAVACIQIRLHKKLGTRVESSRTFPQILHDIEIRLPPAA